jgi:lipopolysaccharide assembly protein A
LRIISYIFLLLIIILGITFATLNSQTVDFNYYVNDRSMPLSLLLTSAFTAGCIMGIGVCLWILLKNKLKTYHLRQQLKMAEKEIENLRAIPLQDKH